MSSSSCFFFLGRWGWWKFKSCPLLLCVCVCVVMRMMNDTRIVCVVPLNRFVCPVCVYYRRCQVSHACERVNEALIHPSIPPPPFRLKGGGGWSSPPDIRLVPYMTAAPCHFLFSPYSDSSSSFCFSAPAPPPFGGRDTQGCDAH